MRNLFSGFYSVFNFRDDMAKGRVSMLASAVIVQSMLPLTSGIFYTGFLIAHDINIVNAGIISFIPGIAALLGVFSPYILERFPRRKTILLVTRLISYTINILGVTVLPLLVHDNKLRIIGFGIILFVSSGISALTAPGFSPWHLNFIPEDVRVDYFGYLQVVRSAVYGAVILASGFAADLLNGSRYEITVLYVLRIAAFFMAVAEILFLSVGKEFPYPQKEVPKLINVFVLTFRCKKFLRVITLIALWGFFASCSASAFNYYLINTAKVSYSYMGFMDALYPFFVIVFSGYWSRYIKKHSWLKTFAVTAFMFTPTVFLHSFVTQGNYLVLMTVVRICQHISGVGLNHSYLNLPYINLPDEDRTNYMAFYTLYVTLFALLGSFLGTAFIAATRNMEASLFGIPFTGAQTLLIIQSIGQTMIAVTITVFRKSLEPERKTSAV